MVELILGLIVFVVYVCSLFLIGAVLLVIEGYEWLDNHIKYIPYTYYEWCGMYSPALLTYL